MDTDVPKISLLELAKAPFLEHVDAINGSIVYLDAGAAELANVSLGAPFLLGLGAINVCDLDQASGQDSLLALLGGETVTTLVFAVTRLLTDIHPQIVKAVLAHPTVTEVVILSSISEHAHACQASTELGVEAYSEYAALLKGDVQDSRAYSQQLAGRQAGQQPTNPAVDVHVSVRHVPMHLCVVEDQSFVLPAHSAPAAMARADGVAAGLQGRETSPAPHLDDDAQGVSGGVALLAHALAAIAIQLGKPLETYAMGPVSHQIAQELVSLPMPHFSDSGTTGRSSHLGLILVDRSLDLVTPCSHQDHIMDMLLASLPRQQSSLPTRAKSTGQRNAMIQWRPLDLRLDIQSLFPTHPWPDKTSSQQQQQSQPPPQPLYGVELFQPHDKSAGAQMEQLVNKKTKDGCQLVRKWLKQGLAAEKLAPSSRTKAGPITPAELLGLATDLMANPDSALRQRQAVTWAHAATAALPNSEAVMSVGSRWELIASLEKQLCSMLVQLGLRQGGPTVCAALKDALSKTSSDKATLLATDVLSVLPAVYSIALDAYEAGDGETAHPNANLNPFTPEDVSSLKDSCVQALMYQAQLGYDNNADEPDLAAVAGTELTILLPHWRSSYTDGKLESEVQAGVHMLFQRLRYIAQARTHLSDLRRVTVTDMFADNPGAPQPLMKSIVRRVLQGQQTSDLLHVTADSLGGLLSKGLSRMGLNRGLLGAMAGNVAQRHAALSECSTILIFVVGGLSLQEAREIRQEASNYTDKQLLVAGTSLVSASDILAQLLI